MSVLGFVDPEILIVFCDHQFMNGLYNNIEKLNPVNIYKRLLPQRNILVFLEYNLVTLRKSNCLILLGKQLLSKSRKEIIVT